MLAGTSAGWHTAPVLTDPPPYGPSAPAGLVAAITRRPTRLLDLLNAEGLTRVDALKLDVEGAEDLILEPFLRQAPESLLPRFLLIENGTGQWQLDLPEHLKTYGYRELKRSRLNLMFERG